MLVAVLIKCLGNRLHHALSQQTSSTQIAFTFLADTHVAVAGARSTVFKFSGGSKAEPFFGCLMRFHFVRHGRRGLSNEVTGNRQAPHIETLVKLESRILEGLFSFLKVFSWVIRKSVNFDRSIPSPKYPAAQICDSASKK